MWPGFEVTTKNVVSGIFLNVECTSKFVKTRTILNMIEELYQKKTMRNLE